MEKTIINISKVNLTPHEMVVKTPIRAARKDFKFKTIGWIHTALIFDTKEKDRQINSRVIKKVFYKNV